MKFRQKPVAKVVFNKGSLYRNVSLPRHGVCQEASTIVQNLVRQRSLRQKSLQQKSRPEKIFGKKVVRRKSSAKKAFSKENLRQKEHMTNQVFDEKGTSASDFFGDNAFDKASIRRIGSTKVDFDGDLRQNILRNQEVCREILSNDMFHQVVSREIKVIGSPARISVE